MGEDPGYQRAKFAALVLISKLLENEEQKEVGVSEMLLRLKGTRSFARTKADIHSSVQSSAHRSVSSPEGKNNY